jgi:hypothetical protein
MPQIYQEMAGSLAHHTRFFDGWFGGFDLVVCKTKGFRRTQPQRTMSMTTTRCRMVRGQIMKIITCHR